MVPTVPQGTVGSTVTVVPTGNTFDRGIARPPGHVTGGANSLLKNVVSAPKLGRSTEESSRILRETDRRFGARNSFSTGC